MPAPCLIALMQYIQPRWAYALRVLPFWPSRSKKPAPYQPVDHDCTHASRYGICFDDALDGGSAVCRIGARKRASRPQGRFASRGPEGEIRHARPPVKVNATQGAQAMHRPVEKGPAHERPRAFALAPQLAIRPS